MRGLRIGVTVLAVAAASTAAGAALAGDGGGSPLKGARYSFTASTPQARAWGTGAFDRKTDLGGTGRVSVARGAVRVEAKVRTWKLSVLGDDATLMLRIEVESSTDERGCPVGTRGLATLSDGRRGDRVRVAFSGGRCAALARTWASGAGAARARVEIRAVFAAG